MSEVNSVLDIKLFRETPEVVEANLRKRGMDTAVVQEIVDMDRRWREGVARLGELRHRRNQLSIRISRGERELVEESKKLKAEIDALEAETEKLEAGIREKLMRMPNILHEAVPVGKDDSENVELRRWGKPRDFGFKPKGHIDLLFPRYADTERAARVSGARFYYLKGKLVQLEFALIRFALDFLQKKGYVPVLPPYMIRRRAMEGVTDFTAFEDTIYKVEGEDLYMIATAEHPIGAMHMDEILDGSELPLKYAGVSPCFRMEAGSHGKDTKGIFRVHQFEKVEQFIFARPDQSWKLHEELIANSEELFRALEIPYRVVDICTGDIGYVAARKYDLEAWLPGQGKYREMVSCSNCTDWQSRRLNVRYRFSTGEKPQFVHTLNSTALAIQRTMIAIAENHQQEDGTIRLPKALHRYLDFKEL